MYADDHAEMVPAVADFAALTSARRLVDGAARAVVLTGAGISTHSGIPDYRGPNGVWTKDPAAEKRATLDVYVSDPEARRQVWQQRLRSGIWEASPNPGHAALVTLEGRGKLHTLITQNIDGLHHAAGNDPARIIEVHGNVREFVCLSCGQRGPMAHALERVQAGEPDPACERCGGILKSATVSFGQSLAVDDLERAFAAAGTCDLFLAIGTTLSVYPIAETVPTALRAGAPLVIVNAEPTPFDTYADVVLRGQISEVLPQVVEP